MPRDRAPAEITVEYRPGASEKDDPSKQVTVALVPAVGRFQTGDEIRVLLRQRLLFLALLLSGTMGVTLLLGGLSGRLIVANIWAYYACTLAVCTLGALFAAVLWKRQTLSLRQLRAIELILFGALYVQWSLVHAFLYPTFELTHPPIWYGFVLGYAVSLPWAFLIIVYGILIPNTGRRCAAVVGVMAVTPLVISTTTGLAARVTAGHSQANFLLVVGECMAAATAIAVYGSHRIERLRREVVATRRLGQYQLGKKLGSGGMGEVYLAEHLLLRRPCAVKLIRPERGGDATSLERFQREVQTTATLTHPNVVQVYDYGHAQDGTFYYAMEYLPGLSLDQLVRKHGPLPPGRAIHFLRQVCGALSEAHAAGLIHRDIKPGNIIVCQRGGLQDVAKLLDFGLVLELHLPPLGSGPLPGEGLAGTPAYMSPEQASGQSLLDARSDLYSLGALAYFLVSGEPPFPRQTLTQMLAAHRNEPAAFPERLAAELPADVKAVVLRCLEKNPARRFPDADSLEQAWAACACANSWTREEMARWWQTHPLEAGPSRLRP